MGKLVSQNLPACSQDVQDRRTLSDHELLHRFVEEEDQAAFEVLVQRHGPWVLGVCRRILGNTHDAEDAFQATFLVLARKASTLQWGDLLSNWLHGVAQRTAQKAKVMAARRNRHEQTHAQKREQLLQDAEEIQRLRAIIDEEMELLPAKFRHPLSKHYLEGKTREETAEELGWSLGAVKGSLERGRQLLRLRLAKRGFACTAALLDLLFSELRGEPIPPELLASAGSRASAKAGRSTRARRTGPVFASLLLACGLLFLGISQYTPTAKQPQPIREPVPGPVAVEPVEQDSEPVSLPMTEPMPEPPAGPYVEPSPIQPLAFLVTPEGWFVVRTNVRTGNVTIAPIDDWDDDDE